MKFVKEWVQAKVFNLVHGHNLVYNTCWEDPRLDRAALNLGPDDTLLVITSAGCNALDYVLAGAKHVYAVDMNPRQNALLELKIAAIRELDYDDFFAMFGQGCLPAIQSIYRDALRSHLSPWAQCYWDRRIRFFDNRRKSFYFRGSSGAFARLMNFYVDHVCRLRPQIDCLLNATTLEEQQYIYYEEVAERFWSRAVKFLMDRDTTLSMVGVPRAQRQQVESQYPGGITRFVQDCVESVFARLPITDNYFWRVYLTGSYTPDCCPEYVRAGNFDRLKQGLADRVSIHTNSVEGFLLQHEQPISRFVLLDHMDWLADRLFPMLELEWQAILNRATPNSRILWRSGGLRADFLERVRVSRGGKIVRMLDQLQMHPELASQLHVQDRVHTYGSFYIADLLPA